MWRQQSHRSDLRPCDTALPASDRSGPELFAVSSQAWRPFTPEIAVRRTSPMPCTRVSFETPPPKRTCTKRLHRTWPVRGRFATQRSPFPRLNYGIHLVVWKAILTVKILAEIAARRLTWAKRKSMPRNIVRTRRTPTVVFPTWDRSHTSVGRKFGRPLLLNIISSLYRLFGRRASQSAEERALRSAAKRLRRATTLFPCPSFLQHAARGPAAPVAVGTQCQRQVSHTYPASSTGAFPALTSLYIRPR